MDIEIDLKSNQHRTAPSHAKQVFICYHLYLISCFPTHGIVLNLFSTHVQSRKHNWCVLNVFDIMYMFVCVSDWESLSWTELFRMYTSSTVHLKPHRQESTWSAFESVGHNWNANHMHSTMTRLQGGKCKKVIPIMDSASWNQQEIIVFLLDMWSVLYPLEIFSQPCA